MIVNLSGDDNFVGVGLTEKFLETPADCFVIATLLPRVSIFAFVIDQFINGCAACRSVPSDNLRSQVKIERHLMRDGFVQRYTTRESVDGLPPGEGAFLACTFWLADNYALMGRHAEARETFERLLALRNDVGLLAEEYDPEAGRQLGNVPQAFSHVCLVNTARNLAAAGGEAGPAPAEQRHQD